MLRFALLKPDVNSFVHGQDVLCHWVAMTAMSYTKSTACTLIPNRLCDKPVPRRRATWTLPFDNYMEVRNLLEAAAFPKPLRRYRADFRGTML